MKSVFPRELQVNVLDPDDIRAKCADVEDAHKRAAAELDAWSQEVQRLALVAQRLRSFLEPSGSRNGQARDLLKQAGAATAKIALAVGEAQKASAAPAQQRVIDIVEQAGRPLKTAEVAALLGFADDPDEKNRIGAALYAATNANRLLKVDTRYAPINYEPEQPSHPAGGGSEK